MTPPLPSRPLSRLPRYVKLNETYRTLSIVSAPPHLAYVSVPGYLLSFYCKTVFVTLGHHHFCRLRTSWLHPDGQLPGGPGRTRERTRTPAAQFLVEILVEVVVVVVVVLWRGLLWAGPSRKAVDVQVREAVVQVAFLCFLLSLLSYESCVLL